MARPLLLLVHGMGSHSESWSSDIVAYLSGLAASYPGVDALEPLDEQVDIRTIRYDDVFDRQLADWEVQGSKLDELTRLCGRRLPTLLGAMNNVMMPPHEKGFVWTHVIDAITYRMVALTRDQVRARVALQVVEAVNQHPDANVTVVAHSLGTIVIHDVLAQMANGLHGAAFKAGVFEVSNLFFLSNATRLGPPALIDLESHNTPVRPGSAGPTEQGLAPYCGLFYNVHHEWDPVCSWRRFAPAGWGPGLIDVPLRHMHQVNVHGMRHYLAHPDVHVRLLRALLGNDVISRSEWQDRASAFPDVPPNPCGETIATLMNRLDFLRGVDGRSLDRLGLGLLDLYRAIHDGREACDAMFNVGDGWM